MMKERFAKLLLGEDMSGGAKGVSTALAISNAITNLSGESCHELPHQLIRQRAVFLWSAYLKTSVADQCVHDSAEVWYAEFIDLFLILQPRSLVSFGGWNHYPKIDEQDGAEKWSGFFLSVTTLSSLCHHGKLSLTGAVPRSESFLRIPTLSSIFSCNLHDCAPVYSYAYSMFCLEAGHDHKTPIRSSP